MASTQTQTQVATMNRPKRGPAAASRPYDYLYDPNYTLSGGRDHARTNVKVMTRPEQVAKLPNDSNMFSELKHKPNATLVLKSKDPLPQGIPRDWDSRADAMKTQTLRDYAQTEARGKDLSKFVAQPKLPYVPGQQTTVSFVAAKDRPSLYTPDQAGVTGEEEESSSGTRTIACQTDYRENETQTDPWTPEYAVRPGSAPEVLTLATLSYGHGLPAGLAEVEMIERARAKREWEKNLPPMSDPARLVMMEEQEAREWQVREKEIEEIQARRLELMKEFLVRRQDETLNNINESLEQKWSSKLNNKTMSMTKEQASTVRTLRKLTEKKDLAEPSLSKRDVIKDYSDPTSKAFAPLQRDGDFSIDHHAKKFNVKARYLDSFGGIMALEASLPETITQPRVIPPKRPVAKGHKEHNVARYHAKLDQLSATMHHLKLNGPPVEPPLRFCEKIEPPPVRPPTPDVGSEIPTSDEDNAVILLQQFLRGRAIQNQMYEGKEQRRDLIDEMRTVHALESAGQQEKDKEMEELLNARAQREKDARHKLAAEAAVDETQGAHVGATLDFLSKELVRLQEERRIHAFVLLAERERRKREAEESAKRDAEERLRAQNDFIFSKIVGVHQNTIETYLEDIILGARDTVADEQSRAHVRDQANAINDIVDELTSGDATEERDQLLEAHTLVSKLVSTFLLPEVEKQTQREQIKDLQKKHLRAAHQFLLPEVEKVEAAARTRPSTAATNTSI